MNPDFTPTTRPVSYTSALKIARQKVGVNRHFQISWSSCQLLSVSATE